MNIYKGELRLDVMKLLPKWPRTFTPKDSRIPLHGKEHVCLSIYWTLVTSFRRNCSTWSHRLPMSTPRFAKFFKPKQIMFQIFPTLRFLFYHLKYIRRDFQARNKYNNYRVWTLSWSLRRRHISGNAQLDCHHPNDCLRSTWILTHGKWIKVEDRAHPVQQQDRFDQWVERACFQYHPSNPSELPSAAAKRRTGLVTSRPPASQERPGPSVTVPSRQIQVRKYPKLTIGADQLFCHQSHGDQPTTIHAAPLGTARVINTLLRVVHGGSSGWGSLPTGYPPTGDPEINDDPYPTENKDPNRRRIVFAGGDAAHTRVSRDVFLNPTPSRKVRKISKE